MKDIVNTVNKLDQKYILLRSGRHGEWTSPVMAEEHARAFLWGKEKYKYRVFQEVDERAFVSRSTERTPQDSEGGGG